MPAARFTARAFLPIWGRATFGRKTQKGAIFALSNVRLC